MERYSKEELIRRLSDRGFNLVDICWYEGERGTIKSYNFVGVLHGCGFPIFAKSYDLIRGTVLCEQCDVDLFEHFRGVKSPKELYTKEVRRLTELTYKREAAIINPIGEKRDRDWHLDHIVSIDEGYIQMIPPALMAHVSNLQMLTKKANSSKGKSNPAKYPILIETFLEGPMDGGRLV